MKKYALGLDYGTNSCRSLIVDLEDGTEVASTVFNYPSGEMGVCVDPREPNLARQNPQDYIDGIIAIVTGASEQAKQVRGDFNPHDIIGIGVDTTGSTPMPRTTPEIRCRILG